MSLSVFGPLFLSSLRRSHPHPSSHPPPHPPPLSLSSLQSSFFHGRESERHRPYLVSNLGEEVIGGSGREEGLPQFNVGLWSETNLDRSTRPSK